MRTSLFQPLAFSICFQFLGNRTYLPVFVVLCVPCKPLTTTTYHWLANTMLFQEMSSQVTFVLICSLANVAGKSTIFCLFIHLQWTKSKSQALQIFTTGIITSNAVSIHIWLNLWVVVPIQKASIRNGLKCCHLYGQNPLVVS